MARVISLRLSDEAYASVKRHADAEGQSMNAWVEGLLSVEDLRRRCAAHGGWMSENPDAVAFAEGWADRNLGDLAQR